MLFIFPGCWKAIVHLLWFLFLFPSPLYSLPFEHSQTSFLFSEYQLVLIWGKMPTSDFQSDSFLCPSLNRLAEVRLTLTFMIRSSSLSQQVQRHVITDFDIGIRPPLPVCF